MKLFMHPFNSIINVMYRYRGNVPNRTYAWREFCPTRIDSKSFDDSMIRNGELELKCFCYI